MKRKPKENVEGESVIEVRTEIDGLSIELHPRSILLRYNGERVLYVPDHRIKLYTTEREKLECIFKQKDQPGCNFFDHVLETVKKSVELTH